MLDKLTSNQIGTLAVLALIVLMVIVITVVNAIGERSKRTHEWRMKMTELNDVRLNKPTGPVPHPDIKGAFIVPDIGDTVTRDLPPPARVRPIKDDPQA